MHPNDVRVTIDELRRALELMLTHVHETAGEEISLRHDMFWAVPSQEMYDVYKRPSELTIGQLSESWEHIQNVLE